MVPIVLISGLQIILNFSCICGQFANFLNNSSANSIQLQSFLVGPGKVESTPQNHFKIPIGPTLPTRILERTNTSIHICTSTKQLNATLARPIVFMTFIGSGGTYNGNEVRWPIYFKILHCSKTSIICSFAKWQPYQKLDNHMCIYDEEDKKEVNINVKEVHRHFCVIPTTCGNLGHLEKVNKKMKNGKNNQVIPIIKTDQLKLKALVVLPSRDFAFDLKTNMTPYYYIAFVRGQVSPDISIKDQQNLHQQDLAWLRKTRNSTINLKPMMFPNLNRNLVERKRNNSIYTAGFMEISKMSGTRSSKSSNSTGLTDETTIPGVYHQRQKREMQIMMARYRKEIKASRRRKRPKTTQTPSLFDDNKYDRISTTPYTFLNVSFTGYSEQQEKTTVKPRIQKPLKMSEQDMEFVYGSGGGYENKRDKGKDKGKSGGWSSKLEVSFTS